MKKIMFFAAFAAVAVMATSCGGSTKSETVQDAEEVEAVEEVSAVPELEDDNLFRPEQAVEQPVVLDFNATWCGPCKRLNDPMDKAAVDYAGRVNFYSVDFERLPETAAAFGIENVPVVVVLHPDGSFDKYESLAPFISAEDLDSKTPEEVTDIIYGSLAGYINQVLE